MAYQARGQAEPRTTVRHPRQIFLRSYPATGSGIVKSKDHRDCISLAGLADFYSKATQGGIKEIILSVRVNGNKPVWIGFSQGGAETLEQ